MVMVTSPYEWNILKWDAKPQSDKEHEMLMVSNSKTENFETAKVPLLYIYIFYSNPHTIYS